MDEASLILALAALAQQHRLRIYACVAAAGDAGISPGEVARVLDISKNLLTRHLALLVDAGLLNRTDHGRAATLRADPDLAGHLLGRLGELLTGDRPQT